MGDDGRLDRDLAKIMVGPNDDAMHKATSSKARAFMKIIFTLV